MFVFELLGDRWSASSKDRWLECRLSSNIIFCFGMILRAEPMGDFEQ